MKNPAPLKIKKPIPFAFVLDLLERVNPMTRPMFGCVAVYGGDKILLVLRDKETHVEDNGVWIATSREHHDSLQSELPPLRAISVFGDGPTNWRILPADSPDFEESVGKLVELILKNDPRVGRTPKPKKSKKSLNHSDRKK